MKAIRSHVTAAVAAVVLSAAFPACAASAMEETKSPAPDAAMTDGEVRKVDKDAGKITLKHGPIDNLQMPGMTMVFKVRDPAVLDKLQAGDKVKFKAEKSGGAIVVTEIQGAK